MHVVFDVLGLPVPQGSHRGIIRGTRAVVVEGGSNEALGRHREWRTSVAVGARDAAERAGLVRPWDGPAEVELAFRFPMPRNRPAWARRLGWCWKATKPDVDKLARAVLDGLTAGGLLVDDARVVRLIASKTEVAEGWHGVRITVDECAQHLVTTR